MADKQINALTAASALSTADLFVVEQGGNSRKATGTQVRTLARTYRGALVTKAANQTTANYTAAPAIAWDAEDHDTDSIHDNVTNNTRLSVPSGVTKVRVGACVEIASLTADLFVLLFIKKNGATGYIGIPSQNAEIGATTENISCWSPVLTVVGGTDYFEAHLLIETDNSITVNKDSSWFAMEIIE